MPEIYHYIAPLPEGINESIMPCYDGYTIYTADRLTKEQRKRAYLHALKHIYKEDWDKVSVQEIEADM